MLSWKPWTLEPVIRLMVSIVVCVCSIWFVVNLVLRFTGEPNPAYKAQTVPMTNWVASHPDTKGTNQEVYVDKQGHDVTKYAMDPKYGTTDPVKKPDENSPLYLAVVTLGLHGSILLMVALLLKREGRTWQEAFGFTTKGFGHNLVLAVWAVLLFLPVGIALQMISVKVLSLFHFAAPEQQALVTLKGAGATYKQVYLVLYYVIVGPPAEEMLFRGVLYPAVRQAGFPRLALWGTSLVFAFIHLSPPIFVPLLVLALALTKLYEMTDNLLTPIMAHSMFNAVNLFFYYYNDDIMRWLQHWTKHT